jgi:hypothetical protein
MERKNPSLEQAHPRSGSGTEKHAKQGKKFESVERHF